MHIKYGLAFTFYCSFLTNGNYRMIQTVEAIEPSLTKTTESRLTINDSTFIQTLENGETLKGKIYSLQDCSFWLAYDVRKTQDTSELGKLLYKSFGNPFFEVQAQEKDKIVFRGTYSKNLHITRCHGSLVKIP